MFFTLSYCNKWSQIGTEATFGGSVASMIWSERQVIETTTRIDISARNYVVHALLWGELTQKCIVQASTFPTTYALTSHEHVVVQHLRY